MKKEISLKDWDYIGTKNVSAKWLRPFCVYTLEEVQKGTIKQEINIGWFTYLLMFIPVHILKLFWCLWDGGLKEFEIESRLITYHYLYKSNSLYYDYYKKAKEILKKDNWIWYEMQKGLIKPLLSVIIKI